MANHYGIAGKAEAAAIGSKGTKLKTGTICTLCVV